MTEKEDKGMILYRSVDLELGKDLAELVGSLGFPENPTPEERHVMDTLFPPLLQYAARVELENRKLSNATTETAEAALELAGQAERDSDTALELAGEVEERAYNAELENEELRDQLATAQLQNKNFREEIGTLERKTVELEGKVEGEYDHLTKMPRNKKIFFGRLQDELARSTRYGGDLSVLVVDADLFKKINDTYGHIVGDEALAGISDVIRESMRETDHVTRYGGEEIALILPRTNQYGARQVAEKIQTTLRERVLHTTEAGEDVKATVTIGITSFNENYDNGGLEAEAFFSRADGAMYQGKKDGRNRIVSQVYNGKGEMVAKSYAVSTGPEKAE